MDIRTLTVIAVFVVLGTILYICLHTDLVEDSSKKNSEKHS